MQPSNSNNVMTGMMVGLLLSILLIGLNHFGTMIAKQLHDLGHQVLAVDRDEARVNAVLPIVTDAQIGDSTNEAFLRSLGINNFDVCQ